VDKQKTFKTKLGTELPLLNLKNKDYLQVAHRVLWFREEHPDWSIETEALIQTDDHSFFKTTIKDTSGRILATGHKYEDKKGFYDHREKAETGSIGRALALVGFGTQFAPELDEEERIVDAPINTKKTENPQTKLLKAVESRKQAWEIHQLKEYIGSKYGAASSKDLSPAQIDELITLMNQTTGSIALVGLKTAQPSFDPNFDRNVK
jgi:hypothetical protein